ncbi:MAG: hypothetical protein OHK0046_16520 [Anaerolineae bacterium]
MFRLALEKLAQMIVAGVTHNYGLDALPNTLHRGQMPVLLVMPVDFDSGQRLFRDRGSGFESVTFSGGSRTVNYLVTHLLLIAPVSTGVGLQTHLPLLVDVMEAYFEALGAQVTLEGLLLEPARVRLEPGEFDYGGVRYIGCAFKHSWVVAV